MSKKRIIKVIIMFAFLALVFTNCPGGYIGHPVDFYCLESSADPSGDITLVFRYYTVDEIWKVEGRINAYTYLVYEGKWLTHYSWMPITLSLKEKIDAHTGIYSLPANIVSYRIHACGSAGSNNYTESFLKINYPKTLSFSDNTVDVGDEITITSTKPFFDPATFSQTKLDTLIDNDYYIVWVEGDLTDDEFILSSNPEKVPVTKDYYVNVTTNSITFKIPPYAKTGKVHIVNEMGFFTDPSDDALVVSEDGAPAYYSSSVDLVVNN